MSTMYIQSRKHLPKQGPVAFRAAMGNSQGKSAPVKNNEAQVRDSNQQQQQITLSESNASASACPPVEHIHVQLQLKREKEDAVSVVCSQLPVANSESAQLSWSLELADARQSLMDISSCSGEERMSIDSAVEVASPTALVPAATGAKLLQFGRRFFAPEADDDGSTSPERSPEVVPFFTNPFLPKIEEVACGSHHVLFRLTDNSVYSFGNNDFGQLGRTDATHTHGRVRNLCLGDVVQMCVGANHNVVVTRGQQLYVWGQNNRCQLGLSDTKHRFEPVKLNLLEVVQAAAGKHHALALTHDGMVFAWGDNRFGQCGLGRRSETVPRPERLQSLATLPVAAVSAGGTHTAVLTVCGAVFMFGNNEMGQLGTGDLQERIYPQQIRALRQLRVIQLICGGQFTCALTLEGNLVSFGANDMGQLGNGSRCDASASPAQVPSLIGRKVLRVACGNAHTLAVVGRQVLAWGNGADGQLGIGGCADNCATPMHLPDIDSPVQAVFAGADHSFVYLSKQRDGYVSVPGPPVRLQSITYLSLDRLKCCPADTVKQELLSVFSSPACLNASFLCANEQKYGVSSKHHAANLDAARDAFELVEQLCTADSEFRLQLCIRLEQCMTELLSSPPDVECLRLYITLPWCHFFTQYDHFTAILVPFAKAVVCLVPNALRVLDSWWRSLPQRHFARLVRACVHGIEGAVNEHPQLLSPDNSTHGPTFPVDSPEQRNVDAVLQLLAMLSKLNTECKKLPFETFYVQNLGDKINVRLDFLFWIFFKRNQKSAFSFCNYPFIFNAHVKTIVMQTDAKVQQQAMMERTTTQSGLSQIVGLLTNVHALSPYFVMHVNRARIVDDTVVQLLGSNLDDLKKPLKRCLNTKTDVKKPLKIQFAGEEADDAGGVKKEFFMLLFAELLHEKYGMFVENAESRLLWFSGMDFVEPGMYATTGMLMGLAIYNEVIIDFHFPLALYKQLLKFDVSLDDFKELCPIEGSSLEQLLDYEGVDVEDVFCLTFDCPVTVLDQASREPLCENGCETLVTAANKHDFVNKYVQYRLVDRVKSSFAAFARGFERVMDCRLLPFFQPQELLEMVEGNENYDWDAFHKETEYKGEYWAKHPTILAFWSAFGRLSLADKKRFLLFLSGSDRVPLLGMSQVKMTIQPCDKDHLPVAHTCFNLLDLPNEPNVDNLHRKLLTVLDYNHGFSLV